MSKFKKELVASHKVEDYFFNLNISRKAPLEILREKNTCWYNRIVAEFRIKHGGFY